VTGLAAGPGDRQADRACVRELGSTRGIYSLLKRAIANFAAADLVRIVKRALKEIQHRLTRSTAAWPGPA
jgi:hypothetical protein